MRLMITAIGLLLAGTALWLAQGDKAEKLRLGPGDTTEICVQAPPDPSARAVLVVDMFDPQRSQNANLSVVALENQVRNRIGFFPATPFNSQAGDAPRRFFLPRQAPVEDQYCYEIRFDAEDGTVLISLETSGAFSN
ncbi:hypothetical protein [Ruegeria profundi]|uniref:hypothetical protein n=1 Tax=Ruegeria profundi TaxID=1685378 RepID=UPI003C79B11D